MAVRKRIWHKQLIIGFQFSCKWSMWGTPLIKTIQINNQAYPIKQHSENIEWTPTLGMGRRRRLYSSDEGLKLINQVEYAQLCTVNSETQGLFL